MESRIATEQAQIKQAKIDEANRIAAIKQRNKELDIRAKASANAKLKADAAKVVADERQRVQNARIAKAESREDDEYEDEREIRKAQKAATIKRLNAEGKYAEGDVINKQRRVKAETDVVQSVADSIRAESAPTPVPKKKNILGY